MTGHGKCTTCRWAKFSMTKHSKPRPIKGQHGECSWPIPKLPVVAISLESSMYSRRYIWPDYENCPVWEPKQGGERK